MSHTGIARVVFSFHLRRRPMYFVVNLILPCCLLAFIAVVTFILQPSHPNRLALNVTILLALSVYQVVVNNRLPTSSDTVPIIVMYFLFVMILCVLSVTATVFVMYLYTRASACPIPTMHPWMHWLICMKLASLLCMKPSPKAAPMSSPVRSRKHSVDADDFKKNSRVVMTPELEDKKVSEPEMLTVMKEIGAVLTEMRDLLRTKHHIEIEDRDRAKEDKRKRVEWILAAAAVDRIFLYLFVLLFFVGTTVFIVCATSNFHTL